MIVAATRLYIGNLNFEATGADLDALFFAHGGHDGQVIFDRDSGKSKGFGFIDCDAEKAAGAIAALNGSMFAGRALKVAHATARNSVGRLTPRP